MKRAGFTLMEVLVACVVLAIGIGGVMSVAFDLLRRSEMPAQLEAASLLAAERLHYFRSQPDPFRSAGGTYYPPPARGVIQDYNSMADFHNPLVGSPRPFVREFLYRSSENQNRDSAEARRNLRERSWQNQTLGTLTARNEIPPTTVNAGEQLVRVEPNPNGNAVETALPGVAPTSFRSIVSPRANNDIMPGNQLSADVAFVREVWVQTNHPMGHRPSTGIALSLFDDINDDGLAVSNLPPYTVAVTVRVFARDPLTRVWDPSQTQRLANGSGPGYFNRRPLATMVGYFGLRRRLR